MALVHHLGQCRYFSKQPSICAVGTPPLARLPLFVGWYLSLPPFVNVKRSSWRSALRRASFVFFIGPPRQFSPVSLMAFQNPTRVHRKVQIEIKIGAPGWKGTSLPPLPFLKGNKLRISRGNLVFVLENPVLRQTHTEAKKGILTGKKKSVAGISYNAIKLSNDIFFA